MWVCGVSGSSGAGRPGRKEAAPSFSSQNGSRKWCGHFLDYGESILGHPPMRENPKCGLCLTLKSQVPPTCCPVRHSGGFTRLLTTGLYLHSVIRAPTCQQTRAQLPGGSCMSAHPNPFQTDPEAGFEKHWRSKSKPVEVAFGVSLEISPISLSHPLFGHSLLLCPAYGNASTLVSCFVPPCLRSCTCAQRLPTRCLFESPLISPLGCHSEPWRCAPRRSRVPAEIPACYPHSAVNSPRAGIF